MRKNAQGAPKVKVDSQLELRNIVEGHTSLDKEKESGSALNLIQWRYVKNPWSLKRNTEIAAPLNRVNTHRNVNSSGRTASHQRS